MLREIDLKALNQNLTLPTMIRQVHSYRVKVCTCMYAYVCIRVESILSIICSTPSFMQ